MSNTQRRELLYWGIRLPFAGREWKIDLWGFGEAAFRADLRASDELRRRLDGADRLAVLRVKDGVCRRPEYRFEVTSVTAQARWRSSHPMMRDQ